MTKGGDIDKNESIWTDKVKKKKGHQERSQIKTTPEINKTDASSRFLDLVTRLAVLSYILKNRKSKKKNIQTKTNDHLDNYQDNPPQYNELWYGFLHNFTLHGFRYVFERGAIVRRFLWLIVLVTAIGAVCVQTERSIRKYFSRPISTTVSLEYSNEIVFPAVTLCNFNFFPHYLINGTIGEKVVSILAPPEFVKSHQENILISPYTENIMDYRSHIPHPNDIDVEAERKFYNEDDDDTGDTNESNYYYRYKRETETKNQKDTPKPKMNPKLMKLLKNKFGNAQKRQNGPPNLMDKTFDFAEFVKKHGHRIGHMIKKCHWKAGKCGPHNFTSVLTNFGLCHTFNSGRADYPLLKVHRAGVDFGLRLQLNVQQDQYYGIFRDSSGFKVMIHDQDEPPLINELGFAIHPGMHTFCGVRKTKIINLPKPWNTACQDLRTDSPRHYTKAACLLKCRAEYIVKACKCRSFEYEGDTPLCLPQQIRDCVRPSVAAFMNESDHCQCPIACEMLKFQPQLSYAQLPAKHFSEALAKIKHIDKHQMRHYLRDNLLELDVYFEEMSTQVIEQVPAYDEESLFGDIGGQVGLFLGASILTILEVIDLLGRVLVIKLSKSQQHLV